MPGLKWYFCKHQELLLGKKKSTPKSYHPAFHVAFLGQGKKGVLNNFTSSGHEMNTSERENKSRSQLVKVLLLQTCCDNTTMKIITQTLDLLTSGYQLYYLIHSPSSSSATCRLPHSRAPRPYPGFTHQTELKEFPSPSSLAPDKMHKLPVPLTHSRSCICTNIIISRNYFKLHTLCF